MNKVYRITGLLLLMASCVGLDQVTKSVARANLKGAGPISILWDSFRLQYSENPGAFLSLGARFSPETRFWLLTVVVGAFLIFTLIYLFFSTRLNTLSTLGLTLIAGGGLSNLLDRAMRTEGKVVDFMNVGIGSLRTGIFNFADMAILLGVTLMMIQSAEKPKENGNNH